MDSQPLRTRQARAAAESALVRVVHHYGMRPGFVLLGGLVPELLCSRSTFSHTGTTDVDVQVNLEIACGSVNTRRLELALWNSEFEPVGDDGWRWTASTARTAIVVKFELLADLDEVREHDLIRFDECEQLGAINLRGTGFAAKDIEIRELEARVGDTIRRVELNVTGLAGYLLSKAAAARSRRQAKDWYDIAFVLLHNDFGGPEAAARRVLEKFGAGPAISVSRNALRELAANFTDHEAQGTRAYVSQMTVDHPEANRTEVAADSVVGVNNFCKILLGS